MTDKTARDQIAERFWNHRAPWRIPEGMSWASANEDQRQIAYNEAAAILAIPELVELDEDQSLPEVPNPLVFLGSPEDWESLDDPEDEYIRAENAYTGGQKSVKDAGFRRVKVKG